MMLVIVIGGGSYNHQFRILIGGSFIGSGTKIQLPLPRQGFPEEALNLVVLNRTDEIVQLSGFFFCGGDCGNFVFLGEQDSQRKAYVSYAGNGNFHRRLLSCFRKWMIKRV